jgi:hypothetical protein
MAERCVCCGAIIPEGRQVCPKCENAPLRAKLIELVNEGIDWREPTLMLGERIADRLIANGVTIAKDNNVPSKWIPVMERLPEVATSHNTRWDKSTDSIRVLCACVQADGKKMVKEGYCKVYSDGFVHWKIPGTIHSVTHWQYLPQPPKGE